MFSRPSYHSLRRLRTLRARRAQRGAVAVLAAMWVSVALVALGAIDIGHFFYARRDLQRNADLAAAAGVQQISNAGGCAAAMNSAQLNATANGLPSNGTVTPTCGRWDTTQAAPTYFTTTGTPMNALKVVVSRPVPFIFLAGQPVTLSATATAQATNIRAFSVSTSLAQLSGGAVNGLMNALLGTNINLSLVSYQGLASAQVSLAALAAALNVGSVSDLLNAKVTISQLATAMITALGPANVATATAVSALGTIVSASTGSTQVNIGDTSSTNGLLAIGLADPQAAASAKVSVLNLLMVAAEVANGQNAINLGVALNLGPLASITAQAKVIQPPVIAVGEAGSLPDGTPRTSAHSAQIEVYLGVKLLNLNLSLGPGFPSLVSVNSLNLPIYVEVGDGTASLQSTECTTQKATSFSSIQAQPGALALCVGGDASQNLTNTTVATQCKQPVQVTSVSVPLLSLSVLNVTVGSTSPPNGFNLDFQKPAPTTFQFNGILGDSDDYQTTNTNGLGSAAGGLVSQLASELANSMSVSTILGSNLSASAAAPLVDALAGALTPVLNSLDLILIPLLQLLGVQVGVAGVQDLGLTCGQAQLVN